ncbi:MAG: hypothetical protein ACLRWP_20585 [Bilophila wadsworthia]
MHTDRFTPLDAATLLRWMQHDLPNKQLFGIDRELFFMPKPDDPFRMERYGKVLETPLGVAAGPHTQLAQNILSAWLCGARYIELKTVQVLDELNVAKPCIDMADEGYNCEWSQELKRSVLRGVPQGFRAAVCAARHAQPARGGRTRQGARLHLQHERRIQP